MNDDRKADSRIEDEFGLNMTMDEALQRFSRVTKEEELAGEKNLPATAMGYSDRSPWCRRA